MRVNFAASPVRRRRVYRPTRVECFARREEVEERERRVEDMVVKGTEPVAGGREEV